MNPKIIDARELKAVLQDYLAASNKLQKIKELLEQKYDLHSYSSELRVSSHEVLGALLTSLGNDVVDDYLSQLGNE